LKLDLGVKAMAKKVKTKKSGRRSTTSVSAINEVPEKGFNVTVGNVPVDFKQIVPSPPSTFTPVTGKKYSIEIITDRSIGDRIPTPNYVSWVAD